MKIHLIRRETIEGFYPTKCSEQGFVWGMAYKAEICRLGNSSGYAGYLSQYRLTRQWFKQGFIDIGGNKYRTIVKSAFGDQQVHLFICWIGTHAQYDKLCKSSEQYSVNNY